MNPISALAGLLSLCGISSVRMFAPTFLFATICRYLPECSWCPEGIVELAASCPSFLKSDFGLVVFGVLGVLEVVANWDDSIRELISESNIDTYVKPVFATLMTYSILTPEQVQVVTAAFGDVSNAVPTAEAVTSSAMATNVASASVVSNAVCAVAQDVAQNAPTESGPTIWSMIGAAFSCGGTFAFCKLRSRAVAAIRELDPDNTLRLNTLLTLFEEGCWLAILPILLAFPLLALILMVILAFLGWVLSRPLKAIVEKRRAHWDAVGRDGMLKAVQTRAIVIFGAGVILSAVPVAGYLVTVVSLKLFVFGVISLFEKSSSRIIAMLVMRFIKLTIFLMSILFSGIPFVGVLLLLPYAISYVMRVQKVKQG